jgi:glycosyltransferase involved in cell wall biosynthesis
VLFHDIPTVFFPRQWSEAFKFSFPLARWLESHVSEFEVVHVHAVFSHACLMASRASRRHKVPCIVRPLGTLDPWSLQQKPFRKQLFWWIAVKQMLKEAAAIHYTTEEEQRLVENSLGLKRGVVIGLGVNVGFLENGSGNGIFRQKHSSLGMRCYILALSRIHPKKGLELLLRTFMELIVQKEFEQWQLVIAGDGEPAYIESLKRVVRESQAEDNVIFPGWLEGPEKFSALHSAELLVLPSLQENFGLCVIESLACGVPVLVSTQVNLSSQIAAARAGWVTSLTQDDLKATLETAMQHKDERERRGLAGKDLVRQCFSWSVISRQLIALYKSTFRKEPAERCCS